MKNISQEGTPNSAIDSLQDSQQDALEHLPEVRMLQQQFVPGSALAKLRNTEGLGPSTLSIIAEADRRGIPWRRLDDCSRILFGYGKNQQLIRATITGNTSCIGVETVDNKYETKMLLNGAGVAVPEGKICSHIDELSAVIDKLGYPLVLKPVDANHGKGVSVNVTNLDAAKEAFL